MAKRHRCAVCWQRFDKHDGWYGHAMAAHGASLAEFGFRECRAGNGPNDLRCPGVDHEEKLPNYGKARVKRARKFERFRAKDGTIYTPVLLPLMKDVE